MLCGVKNVAKVILEEGKDGHNQQGLGGEKAKRETVFKFQTRWPQPVVACGEPEGPSGWD